MRTDSTVTLDLGQKQINSAIPVYPNLHLHSWVPATFTQSANGLHQYPGFVGGGSTHSFISSQ